MKVQYQQWDTYEHERIANLQSWISNLDTTTYIHVFSCTVYIHFAILLYKHLRNMDIYDVGVVKIIACDCLAIITHNDKMNKKM